MKLILAFSLLSLFFVNLHAVKRDLVLHDKELSEKENPYIFTLQPLFSNKDKVLLGEHKILKREVLKLDLLAIDFLRI